MIIYDPKIHGKKRELFTSKDRQECLNWEEYDEAKHQIVYDQQTGFHSVFMQSAKKTVERPVSRETRDNYLHYHRKIVITLEKDDHVSLRLKGCQRRVKIATADLYTFLLQCEARTALAERQRVNREKRRAKFAKLREKVQKEKAA